MSIRSNGAHGGLFGEVPVATKGTSIPMGTSRFGMTSTGRIWKAFAAAGAGGRFRFEWISWGGINWKKSCGNLSRADENCEASHRDMVNDNVLQSCLTNHPAR